MSDFSSQLINLVGEDSKRLLSDKVLQELEEIDEEIKRLEEESQKYDKLVETLDNLPRELGWSVPYIPISKHALLLNAEIKNTNEIQVHIGDEWFTRCAAHHAKTICHRRKEKCSITLEKLAERKVLIEQWLSVTTEGKINADDEEIIDVFNEEKEINEFITEEEYLIEKEKHRTKAKEYYLKERTRIKELEKTVNNENVMELLEKLEIEEQGRGELREKKKKSKVSFSDNNPCKSDLIKNESKTFTIEFNHSESLFVNNQQNNIDSTPVINTPNDLYEWYQKISTQTANPKSILKKGVVNYQTEFDNHKKPKKSIKISSQEPAVIANDLINDIVEKSLNSEESNKSEEIEPKKKLSKFKASRMNK